MRSLRIGKYIITEPLINVINHLKATLTNGKLKDIRPRSTDIVVTCPVHSDGREANPDCNIYIGDDIAIPYGFARCFACDFQGQFYHFVAKCFDSSDEYAKNWLIKNFGKLAEDVVELDDFISLDKPKKEDCLNEAILETYQHWTPYLSKRHLDADICDKLKVRYDPKFRQVIFPVYDIKGHLKMLAKRSIDTKTFYLDKNQEKEVYCLNIIQKNNIEAAVICEGLVDCVTSFSYGMPAIATLGNPSMYQIKQIKKSCLKIIYLCMDNDESGRRFTEFLRQNLADSVLLLDVKLPNGKKDINELDREEFINCINSAN